MASRLQPRNLLLGSVLMIVIVVVVLVWNQSPEPEPESAVIANTQPVLQPEMRPPENTPSPPTAMAQSVWTSVNMDSSTSGLPVLKEGVTDAVPVSYDLLSGNFEQGDPVNIEIPQLQKNYMTMVSRIKRQAGNNTSISGYLIEGEHKKYGFVITIGKSNTFAHINTPEGSFELVGSEKMGWLMPVSSMDQNKNYSKPDYVVLKSEQNTSPEQEE